MNTIKKIGLFFLSVFTIIYSFAQEQNEKIYSGIIGKGVADNYNQALEIAKRDALERSVGVYISSETIIKNDSLFKEKIYSLSSGFVKKYSIISDLKLSEKITEIIISADISKDAVIEEVKKLGVTVELNGGGLFDEMMQIKNYEDNEYSLFQSLFRNPSNYSPYTYTLTYDKPVFDEGNKEWTLKLHIQGRVDSSGKAILYKTKNILENAGYDNNRTHNSGLLHENTSCFRLDQNSSEYKQLLIDYQSKTCVKEGWVSSVMLTTQINEFNRKPYSPYLIELNNVIYTVKDVRTFLFLRMFYFFEFLPNLKVKFLGNDGNVLREEIINKKIRGVTSRPKNQQYPNRFFEREFCEKTLNNFTKNYNFNIVNCEYYKRNSYYDREERDHDVARLGSFASSPYTPFLDLNCYSDLTIEYDFIAILKETDFKSISKIEVEGLPVLLKKDQ